MNPEIKFEEEEHTYWNARGLRIPSVTEVIQKVILHGDQQGGRDMEAYFSRGRAVHKASEYLDAGENRKAMNCLVPEYHGFLGAYQKAKENLKFKIVERERVIHHPIYGYCGRLDLLATFPRRHGDVWIIGDLKTGSVPKSTRYQEAAYLMAYAHGDQRIDGAERYGLELHEDETYRVVPFAGNCREDFIEFCAALVVLKMWIRNKQIKEKPKSGRA